MSESVLVNVCNVVMALYRNKSTVLRRRLFRNISMSDDDLRSWTKMYIDVLSLNKHTKVHDQDYSLFA